MDSHCRLCFTSNASKQIVNTELQEIFQNLTLLPFKSEHLRPQSVCFTCFALLRKLQNLKMRWLQAKQHLQMADKHNEMPHTATGIYICPTLPPYTIQQHDNIDVNPKDKVRIKMEDQMSSESDMVFIEVDVKKEVVLEDDILQMHEDESQGAASANTDNGNIQKVIEDNTPTSSNENKSELKEFKALRSELKKYPDTSSKCEIGGKPFKCDICHKGFRQKQSISRHIATHTGVKPFKCDICQKGFTQKYRLISHIATHTGDKPFKCNICEKSFVYPATLKEHTRLHTGVRLFQCDICQRRFTQQSLLNRHIDTHTSVKPFKCDICLRRFTQKCNLNSHIVTHTGVKPFKCDICQRGFTTKYNLNSHTATHTGDKPFECHICQRGFTQKYNLNRHILSPHSHQTGSKQYSKT